MEMMRLKVGGAWTSQISRVQELSKMYLVGFKHKSKVRYQRKYKVDRGECDVEGGGQQDNVQSPHSHRQ